MAAAVDLIPDPTNVELRDADRTGQLPEVFKERPLRHGAGCSKLNSFVKRKWSRLLTCRTKQLTLYQSRVPHVVPFVAEIVS
jgi:hypothetical protein